MALVRLLQVVDPEAASGLQAPALAGGAEVWMRFKLKDRSGDVDGGLAARAGRSCLEVTSAAIDAAQQDMV